jgi:hypothetical protein
VSPCCDPPILTTILTTNNELNLCCAVPLHVLQPAGNPGSLFHPPHRVTFAADAKVWGRAPSPPPGLHIPAAERLLLQPVPPPGLDPLPAPATPPSPALHESVSPSLFILEEASPSSPSPDEFADDIPFVQNPDNDPEGTFGDYA